MNGTMGENQYIMSPVRDVTSRSRLGGSGRMLKNRLNLTPVTRYGHKSTQGSHIVNVTLERKFGVNAFSKTILSKGRLKMNFYDMALSLFIISNLPLWYVLGGGL